MKPIPQTEKLNRIAEVLEKQGRSQLWLSERLGISKTAVNNLCKQRSQPTLQRIRDISRVLGVSMCDLIQEEEPPKK